MTPEPTPSRLSLEAKEKYVQLEGQHCPYCDSGDLEYGSVDFSTPYCNQKVICEDCGKDWWDVYKFHTIEEVEEV